MKTINELLKEEKEYTKDFLNILQEKPWDYEPNYYKFWHRNLPIWIKRGPMGQLNGYVGIPIPREIIKTKKKFKYFDYKIFWNYEDYLFYKDYLFYDLFNERIRTHGGLTYSNFENGYLVLGFDTGHRNDYSPYLDELIKNSSTHISSYKSEATYKTFRYVYEGCTALTDQLYMLLGLNKTEKYYRNFYDNLELNYKYIDYNVFCRERGEINVL